jgi:hypothetical protein
MANHVLKHEGRMLHSLLAKVEELKKWNLLFSQELDPDLASHCEVIKIEKDCLIVFVDNSHWVTQLRFYIPELLKRLHKLEPFQQLKAICAKVKPKYSSEKKSPSRKMKPLSQQTANAVLEIVKEIKDERIKDIFSKIAKRDKIS